MKAFPTSLLLFVGLSSCLTAQIRKDALERRPDLVQAALHTTSAADALQLIALGRQRLADAVEHRCSPTDYTPDRLDTQSVPTSCVDAQGLAEGWVVEDTWYGPMYATRWREGEPVEQLTSDSDGQLLRYCQLHDSKHRCAGIRTAELAHELWYDHNAGPLWVEATYPCGPQDTVRCQTVEPIPARWGHYTMSPTMYTMRGFSEDRTLDIRIDISQSGTHRVTGVDTGDDYAVRWSEAGPRGIHETQQDGRWYRHRWGRSHHVRRLARPAYGAPCVAPVQPVFPGFQPITPLTFDVQPWVDGAKEPETPE